MATLTDDDVRAMAKHLRERAERDPSLDAAANLDDAADMLSSLIAERAEVRDEALEEAAKAADAEPMSGEPPAHFTAMEVKCVKASYYVTKSSIAKSIRALKSSPALGGDPSSPSTS